MFDIGLSELLLLGAVALIAIRPEQLPDVARTLARLIGRAQRGFNAALRGAERDLGITELRRELRNEAIVQDIDGAEEEMLKLQAELRADLRPGSEPPPAEETDDTAGGGSR